MDLTPYVDERMCRQCGSKPPATRLSIYCMRCRLKRMREGVRKPRGARHPDGTKLTNAEGYVRVYVSGHPVLEHRYVMEQVLGRALIKGESVHHKDGNRSNNSPDNLELWVTSPRYGQRATDIMCPHCGKGYLDA